jgi:protein-L-isoaspartate(D-aspartate) O-methyltransferase
MMTNQKIRKNNLINVLKEQGFEENIVEAFRQVKRERFVPAFHGDVAYEDIPLPIGQRQTISQPSTIAFMLSLLNIQNGQKILEVGSGSGYVLALFSTMNSKGKVMGAERIKELVESSKEKLEKYENVKIFYTPHTIGLEEHSLFDRILVSASAQEIPQELVEQLKMGGILVIPVGNSIIKLEKTQEGNKIEEHEGFVFVPLVKD